MNFIHIPNVTPYSSRIQLLDLARGIALIAMTLFHFGWDLDMFGFVYRGFANQPAMVWFARVIASSFLFLVGVGLVLAHQKGFSKKAILKRTFMVGGAAAATTIATWFATPEAYIFFGILHHITLASFMGLIFIRLQWWITAVVAAIVLYAGLYIHTPILDDPIWWWTGLSEIMPKSNDYVPVFPFFAFVLSGIALANLTLKLGVLGKLQSYKANGITGCGLKFIGRHSLVYYLLHQPIMIGILYIIHILTR